MSVRRGYRWRACLCAFLDQREPALDAGNTAVQPIEATGNADIIFVKSGDLAAQIDNLGFRAKHLPGHFVEPGIDAVETLVDAGKPAAQKIDYLVLVDRASSPFN